MVITNYLGNGLRPLILLSLLPIGLVSCDPVTYYEQKIDNRSNYEILLVPPSDTLSYWLYGRDTIHMLPGTVTTIFKDGGIGTVSGYEDCHLYADTINTFIDSLHQLNPDLGDANNWRFHIIDQNRIGGGECECILIITDANIE